MNIESDGSIESYWMYEKNLKLLFWTRNKIVSDLDQSLKFLCVNVIINLKYIYIYIILDQYVVALIQSMSAQSII